MPQIGDHVIFVDSKGREHAGVLIAIHGSGDTPSVNVMYADPDETKTDSYGRQIARSTSVVHRSNQAAHGYYWREP